MQTLTSLLRTIPSPDSAAMLRAQQHIDGLLKPPGSLGRLESLAVQLAGMPGPEGYAACEWQSDAGEVRRSRRVG